jgi:hypothetical protein
MEHRYAMMTLTTVGYELHPATFAGKLTGGLCALLGVFILTLPIPIVVNSFASYYKNRFLNITDNGSAKKSQYTLETRTTLYKGIVMPYFFYRYLFNII